jgi:hypothetical protein
VTFEAALQVANAVLYEGYVLYPYRASAAKNQVRWQFGVLAPKGWSEAGGSEPWEQQTQCLLEAGPDAAVSIRLRFLRVQRKVVEAAEGEEFTPVESLSFDGASIITWEEAVEHQVDIELPVDELLAGDRGIPVSLTGTVEPEEIIHDAAGAVVGRVRRSRQPLEAIAWVGAEPLEGPFGGIRLTVRTENLTPWEGDPGARKEAMSHSLVACHSLLAITPDGAGRFISLLEPPEWARPAAQACVNLHTFPVLVGNADPPNVVLSSPIILYDFPQVAPESQGDLFDATEIDEILTLRTMTLTDEEKAEARATDPRAAAIIDRVDSMPPELLDRLHGAVRYLRDVTGEAEQVPELATGADGMPLLAAGPPRGESTPWWDPGQDTSVSPDTDAVEIGGVRVAKGSTVRLRPGARRSDAQDMFVSGRFAEVQAVFRDLEDKPFLAVTLADDPNADLTIQHGRFMYFAPDEVDPLGSQDAPKGTVSA